jgi:hypothetical protein
MMPATDSNSWQNRTSFVQKGASQDARGRESKGEVSRGFFCLSGVIKIRGPPARDKNMVTHGWNKSESISPR